VAWKFIVFITAYLIGAQYASRGWDRGIIGDILLSPLVCLSATIGCSFGNKVGPHIGRQRFAMVDFPQPGTQQILTRCNRRVGVEIWNYFAKALMLPSAAVLAKYGIRFFCSDCFNFRSECFK
jgi:hypothetical protein